MCGLGLTNAAPTSRCPVCAIAWNRLTTRLAEDVDATRLGSMTVTPDSTEPEGTWYDANEGGYAASEHGGLGECENNLRPWSSAGDDSGELDSGEAAHLASSF